MTAPPLEASATEGSRTPLRDYGGAAGRIKYLPGEAARPTQGAVPMPPESSSSESRSLPKPRAVELRFRRLADEWKAATRAISSPARRYGHIAYQRILAMGPDVIPFLLRDLPDDWFFALFLITDADPVRPEDQGKIPAMTEAWRKWGREQGYLV